MKSQHPEKEQENYQNFAERFQKAETFLNNKKEKGVILMGNTRAGKSTLACAAAGSEMEFDFDGQSDSVSLKPTSNEFRSLVTDSLSSVTEKPNYFPSRHKVNQYAIVDMPGYADSSRFRQLINFHYIQTMTRSLEEVRFLIVINMSIRDNRFQIDHLDLKMMESFCQMFPQTGNLTPPISIIVNKLEHPNTPNLLQKVRVDFASSLEELTNSAKIRKYFTVLGKNFHVVLRPKYPDDGNSRSWKVSGNAVRDQMMKICNQDAQFIPASNLRAQLRIFKEGDAAGNVRLEKTVIDILDEIAKGISKGYIFYQKSIANMLKFAVTEESVERVIEKECTSFLKPYKQYDRQCNLNVFDERQVLWEAKLLNQLWLIFRKKNQVKEINSKQFTVLKEQIQAIMGKLVLLVCEKYPKLKVKLDKFYIQMLRFMEQTLFLVDTFLPKDSKKVQQESSIISKLQEVFQELKSYQVFETINDTKQIFKKFIGSFISCDIKKLLRGAPMTSKVRDQMIEAFNLTKNLYSVAANIQELPQDISQTIKSKINQVEIYFLLTDCPLDPDAAKRAFVPLFQKYGSVTQKDVKFRLAFKIASLLEQQKDGQKRAVGLYLHLEKHEDVMRLLNLLAESNKANAVQWYMCFAEEYRRKSRFTYFEKCIQLAKRYAVDDVERLVDLEEMLVRGAEEMLGREVKQVMPREDVLKREGLKEKMGYWCWERIDEEIKFLRQRVGNQPALKNMKDIVAIRLR